MSEVLMYEANNSLSAPMLQAYFDWNQEWGPIPPPIKGTRPEDFALEY